MVILMTIGIISDIHGNLEALESTLNFLKGKTDILVSLGDIVGYGPDPEKCVEIISEKNMLALRGNHEESLITEDFSRLKDTARISLEWTQKNLPFSYIEKFKGWPEKAEKTGTLFAHASLSNPLYRYIFTGKDTEEEFPLLNGSVCFIGHTHTPGAFKQDISTGKIETILPDFSGTLNIVMDTEHKYIINTGSVGQPRDGFPFACAVIYEKEKGSVNLHRIEYPSEITRKKIIERGLPSVLAGRILRAI